MMKRLSILSLAFMASPALASEAPWYSPQNPHAFVMVAFLLFVGVVLYFKVPGMIAGMLDKRSEGIRSEIAEARKLREEAQSILASFERKQKEVASQTADIIEHAKAEATIAAEAAKADLEASIVRRLQAAEEQIKSAETAAVREIRDRAVALSIASARDVIAANMSTKDAVDLISQAIKEVGDKLH